ncbi:Lin0512 family protein [Pontibacillus sp. ALD_SL1]|uniref:Lin0512 family protein n=1 Tax=Pontibacillus sp. ALD_SL1 TaxID=2777185 RepID=UPI001A95867F|nr:Lin0512 family protein [Pontibacillus sp. ALD_SL1]QSS98573.1 Lin0512 family protein [Pontibacillus sp. ALD_SL1]
MEQLVFIETGMGVDVHGQNVTKAAVRAVKNAIHTNSMPGIKNILPEQSLDNMVVNIKLAVPCDHEKLDLEEVRSAIPYGTVTVEVMDGGMLTTSGIHLEEKEDKNDLMYIVNASVEVGY